MKPPRSSDDRGGCSVEEYVRAGRGGELSGFYRRFGSVLGRLAGHQPLFEQVHQQQRSDPARAFRRVAGGQDIWRYPHAVFSDHFQSFYQRDSLRAEGFYLLGVGDALGLAHQAHLFGFGLTGGEDIVRFALAFRLALLGSLAGDLDSDGDRHQIPLIVGLRPGLFELDAFLFRLALSVEHILSLLRQYLFRLRLHQLFRQVDVADKDVDHIDVVLEQVRAHSRLRPLLFLVAVLEVGHGGGFGSLVAEDRIYQRMHHVLYQPVDGPDLRDHKGRVLRPDAKDHANLQLHREAVF